LIDDETKEPQDTSDEGSEAAAAGPVEAEDSTSTQAAGEEPTATPPADDAEETPTRPQPLRLSPLPTRKLRMGQTRLLTLTMTTRARKRSRWQPRFQQMTGSRS
jgi:hypothetical protein